ncbi:MAG: hypothetical protein LAO23_11910 [Acidobacteriia bacterium]|nr:hypothetical protein [Terriglobia bacterium]
MASDPARNSIRIPIWLWRRIVIQLRLRGMGERESGAFLLAPQDGPSDHVTAFICYDDLDPNAYQGGAIAFHAVGHAALWGHCRKNKLRVVADVHTHPGRNVGQSPIDKRNPMIPVQDHTAIIVPNFGNTSWWSLDGAGIHEYLGNFEWRSHPLSRGKHRVSLTLW